jgi:hypothetical protein
MANRFILKKGGKRGIFHCAEKSSEHRNVAEQQSTIAAKTTVAQEQKQIEALNRHRAKSERASRAEGTCKASGSTTPTNLFRNKD